MKLKVSEATNTQLNWLVAKCEGFNAEALVQLAKKVPGKNYGCFLTNYSTNWSQSGPIIKRERIETRYDGRQSWCAWINGVGAVHGSTLLIAAMRCFVFSNLGNEVEVPDELGKEG